MPCQPLKQDIAVHSEIFVCKIFVRLAVTELTGKMRRNWILRVPARIKSAVKTFKDMSCGRRSACKSHLPVFGRGIDLCIGKIALKFHSNAESDRRQSDIRLFHIRKHLTKRSFRKNKITHRAPFFRQKYKDSAALYRCRQAPRKGRQNRHLLARAEQASRF